ncbi:hypothetical protein ACQUSY_08730 [Microbacterium sp. YY-03]|uniref:hypothetical protein n=1 Tax=Microbacterium sp. YY-03 TaxID=3421636 RepID=UPI003D17207E
MSTTLVSRRLDVHETAHLQALPTTTAPLRELTITRRVSVRVAIWLLAHVPAPINHTARAEQLRLREDRERRELVARTEHYLHLVRV